MKTIKRYGLRSSAVLGTANQLTVTDNGNGTITISLATGLDALVYKGVIDCLGNPNYPAADAGHVYIVSVAGKIGGASGLVVAAGDLCLCNTDGTAAGDQATVGSRWNVIEKNIDLTNIIISGGTISGVAFSDLTASRGVITDANKVLASDVIATGTGAPVRAISPAIETPTGIVKADVGLGNVDNTSDANKIVSTAQQTALNAKIDKALFDTQTILAAVTDDTPVAVTIAVQQVIGRLTGGDIKGLTTTELTALLNAATETLKGAVELATDAEAVTGTDTGRAVTPANLVAKMSAPGPTGDVTPAAGTFTQIKWAKGADVASANALVLSTDGNYSDITGTTAITSIGTLGVGIYVCLHFDGALTLTHHATDLILPGSANITTAAGDEAILIEYAAGNWRCINYSPAVGNARAGVNADITSMTGLDNDGIPVAKVSGATAEVNLKPPAPVAFAGSSGHTITHNYGHTDYQVIINPVADPGGFLGEIWISKAANTAVVYNSGSATGNFDYVIIPAA